MMYRTDIKEYNFEVNKGDTTQVDFRLLASGSPADLTGSILHFVCAEPTLNQFCAMPIPRSGRFSVSFHRDDTSQLNRVNLKYKIVRYPAGLLGPKVTLFSGKFRLVDEDL